MKLIQHNKIINVAMVIVTDIIVSGTLIKMLDLDSFSGVLAIVFLLLLALLMYFVVFYLKRSLSFYFGINIILAPVILYALIILSIVHGSHSKFQTNIFFVRKIKYEIHIMRVTKTYGIYQVMDSDNSSFRRIIDGYIVIRNDTTYFGTSAINHPIFINKDTLIGFPNFNDKAILSDD